MESATEQESLTAVVRNEEGDVEDVFFGTVSSRSTASDGDVEGLADVTAVRVGDESGVIDVGDLQETIVDFEIETDDANQNPIIEVQGQQGRDIRAEQVLSEFSGRISEQEIHGRSKELRFTDTDFGEKGFSESAAVDPEDDFIIGFEEFQSAVSRGQRAEGSTRSTIVEEDALRSLELEETEPEIDPDARSLDDLSPAEVEELQSTAEAIFGEPADGELEPESESEPEPELERGGEPDRPVNTAFETEPELERGGEPDRPMDTAFETEPEPEQEPDIAGPVQEAEREAFRQVVEGELESEPEPEPELEPETEPVVDPENLLRTSFEQDQQLDPMQDDDVELGEEPALGQFQSVEQEQTTRPVQEIEQVQEPIQEPVAELFIEPEPELEPRRSPRPVLDFDENDGLDTVPEADSPLAEGQDVEFAPSLEAIVFDIRGEVDEDEELTGLEVRPIDEDFEF